MKQFHSIYIDEAQNYKWLYTVQAA